jgi:hypothetical protein
VLFPFHFRKLFIFELSRKGCLARSLAFVLTTVVQSAFPSLNVNELDNGNERQIDFSSNEVSICREKTTVE